MYIKNLEGFTLNIDNDNYWVLGMCSGLNHLSSKSHVEALTLSVAVFGDRVFKEKGLNEVLRVGI